jgi:hypothetical protein
MNISIVNQLDSRILFAFLRLQLVLSGFALHLASHFGKSLSSHGKAMTFQTIHQTVSPATLQIPDPS